MTPETMFIDDLKTGPIRTNPNESTAANEFVQDQFMQIPHVLPLLENLDEDALEVILAVYHALVLNVTAVTVTGNLPASHFYWFDAARGLTTPQIVPQRVATPKWSRLSRIIYARGIIAEGERLRANVALHVSNSQHVTTIRDGISTTRPHHKITAWSQRTGLAITHYTPIRTEENRTTIPLTNSTEPWITWQHEFDRISAFFTRKDDPVNGMRAMRDLIVRQATLGSTPDDIPELIQPTSDFLMRELMALRKQPIVSDDQVQRCMLELELEPELAGTVRELVNSIIGTLGVPVAGMPREDSVKSEVP